MALVLVRDGVAEATEEEADDSRDVHGHLECTAVMNIRYQAAFGRFLSYTQGLAGGFVVDQIDS